MAQTMKVNKKDFELNVSLSYKVKNGSIKVSENDLKKLMVGIVEEVVVTKVGDDEGLTIMLFSDSHIKSGNVIMSVSDANGMDLEEGDKVTIKKQSSHNKSMKTTKLKSKQGIINNPKNIEKIAESVNKANQKPNKKSVSKNDVLIEKNKKEVNK
jgi:hypothetical protein